MKTWHTSTLICHVRPKKFELSDFYDIYNAIPNDDLRKILSSLHAQLNHWSVTLNGDLRTRYDMREIRSIPEDISMLRTAGIYFRYSIPWIT